MSLEKATEIEAAALHEQTAGDQQQEDGGCSSSIDIDEDSGHDSVDETQTASDERERIAHLETAVAWIRKEVALLKDYDRDILQDLWKVRSSIHQIRDSQSKTQNLDESKYLELDASTSPSPCHTPDLIKDVNFSETFSSSPGSAKPPLHLTPHHPPPSTTTLPPSPPSTSTLVEIEKPSAKNDQNTETIKPSGTEDGASNNGTSKSNDDNHILEEFFGSAEFDRLNQLKLGLDYDTTNAETSTHEKSEQSGSPSSISLTSTSVSSVAGGAASSQLLQSQTSEPSGSQTTIGLEMDVVSEMQKLRIKLQETTRAELAALDRQFSPKYDLNADGNHSRQGSLDSSIPAAVSSQIIDFRSQHTRQYSLPIDPSTLPKRAAPPPPPSSKQTSGTSRLAPPPPSHKQQQQQSPRSPLMVLNRATHYDSSSLDRRSTSKSRSPTPPYLYQHIKQGSSGSASSGSGGAFSPPPPPLPSAGNAMLNYQYQPPTSQSGVVSPTFSKSFNTPPPIRVNPSVNQPQYYSFRQSRTGSEPAVHPHPHPPAPAPPHHKLLGRVQSSDMAAVSGNNPSSSRLPPRPSSGKVTSMSRVRNMVQQGGGSQVLPDAAHLSASSGNLQGRPSSARTHYSTSVVKKRVSPDRDVKSTADNQQQQFPHMRNGYPASVGPSMYDRLQSTSIGSHMDYDQPEQKSIMMRNNAYQKPFIKPKLEPRKGARSNGGSAAVYPEEEIQPYVTSGELAAQFKYTPYTEHRTRAGSVGMGGAHLPPSGGHIKQSSVPEQTWC